MAAGVGVGVANTILPTRFQDAVEPAVQGRVFALVGAMSVAGRPIGLMLTAPLAALVGVRAGLAVCGTAWRRSPWWAVGGCRLWRCDAIIDGLSIDSRWSGRREKSTSAAS